ncbi:sensor histidine kinase [Actinomadura alba]|uniref:Sensor histidine kinase n=1 Tax=Actinomadura alba TaxID=406431 RepID=A0ABR7LHS2_9ACTN|nr:sensor histidine kinase [Actinomadura alba]MBC6464325.1 sensor histidine kinase [Actinomadura alba]
MQLRVLAVGVTVLFDANVRRDVVALCVLAAMAVSSGLVLAVWERVVPRLLKHPALLGFDVLLGYAVLEVGGIFGPYFLVTVVAAGIAGLLYQWRVTALLCLQQTVLYYAAMHQNDTSDELSTGAFPLLLAMPVFYPTAALVGAVLRRLFDEQVEVEETRWRMEAMALAADERARLAREMHDSLTKTLAGIALSAKALPLWVRESPERAEVEAKRIESAAAIASREARTLISDLRIDVVRRPLGTAIGEVAEKWSRASGVPVRTTAGADAEVPLRARHEAVAVVKEALQNVGKHAKATSVTVRLSVRGDRLEVRVSDDGRGFAAPAGGDEAWLDGLADDGHYGIVGMHERVQRVGGDLAVRSEPGAGTEIMMSLPLDDVASAAEAAAGRRTGEPRGKGLETRAWRLR